MHQPEYRDLISGRYQLPWTYLHAIKDYVDMAVHLEEHPQVRAVVNFVPVLLDQIADYAVQVQGYLNGRMAIRDPLLAALDAPVLPVRREERIALISSCLRINQERLVDRFPAYRRLVDIAQWMTGKPDTVSYFGDQYLIDLLVWYHLAWLGETVRRDDARIKALVDKGSAYTLQDRRQLLTVIGELLASLLDRYRALSERGQVELSMTPYAHPIAPLLMDFNTAREALDLPLPDCPAYPEGEQRVRWHMEEGLATFERHFGVRPRGCWPAEGGVSAGFCNMLDDMGFAWTASGGTVLHNTLERYFAKAARRREHALYTPYLLEGRQGPACFFRDDGLSDLIGFTYADWHAEDAVNNFIHHLDTIAGACGKHDHECAVSIILDGENAWEYYPENGYHFLDTLYSRLSEHPGIELTTFSSSLHDTSPQVLPGLVSGSWVYGTFTTWIGSRDKNRGWDLLDEAKHTFDRVLTQGRLSDDQISAAVQQLAVCEASDWFWWFGDYNPAESVSEFEHLFRLHLGNLYRILGEAPPDSLAAVISHGKGQPAHGGTMRPGQAIS